MGIAKTKSRAKTVFHSILKQNIPSGSYKRKVQGHPTRKIWKNASNAVFYLLISFYGLLKGYLCKLTKIDLFGCGS